MEVVNHPENRVMNRSEGVEDSEPEVDPIDDIIDYLVRCSHCAFPSARVGEAEPSNAQNASVARKIYQRSVSEFLARFGKHLAIGHLQYFENSVPQNEQDAVKKHLKFLKHYHSDEGKHKRIKNRRYKALQQLQDESDYFSEKEMMFRNPLLYEQLIGQYLTDEEIAQRDGVDSDQLTFVSMILDTVDRNKMRQTKNEQELCEKLETSMHSLNSKATHKQIKKAPSESRPLWGEFETCTISNQKNKDAHWGEFEKPDTTPSFTPDERKQSLISAPERDLLRHEFFHEMYGSFLQGRDEEFDYESVDNSDQYDDLQTVDRDKEEEYFDSEPVESDNLEQTMQLAHEYPHVNHVTKEKDELDVFMEHLNKRRDNSLY